MASSSRLPTIREALIMAILVKADRYGLEIGEHYRRNTGRAIPEGSLFGTLLRLEEKGLIKGRLGRSTHEGGGNRRTYFSLTAAGNRALRALESWMAQMGKALGRTRRGRR